MPLTDAFGQFALHSEVSVVDPASVSTVVKPLRLNKKRFPRVGEMVRIEDRKGLFLVRRVDRHQCVVDLMQRARDQERLEQNVPLTLVRSVPKPASRVIQEFLRS